MIAVRGGASAEEIAAVLAALTVHAVDGRAELSGYDTWRQGRIAVLRHTLSGSRMTAGRAPRTGHRY